MYVVTGITGQVGSATARHLLRSGKAIRAVVRNAEKAAPWAAKGCDVAVADMLDRTGLASAFSGADAVFVLIPPIFDPSEGFPEMRAILASLLFAIEKTAPPRVVCLSTVGAQVERPNLLNQLGLMEKQFAGLSAPVAFLRAAWFMENFVWDVPAARDEGVFRAFLQPLDHAIPMVATDDIGQVAAALMQENWSGTRTVELQGPVHVSANDVARSLATALARPVRTEAVPRDRWEATFRSAGMKNPIPRIQMLDGFNEGWLAFSGNTEQRTGPTTLLQVLTGMCDATGPSVR